MPIRFACPVCRAEYTVANKYEGRKANCQKCGQRLQVPPALNPPVQRTVLEPIETASPLRPRPKPTPAPASYVPTTAPRTQSRRTIILGVTLGLIVFVGGFVGLILALRTPDSTKKPTAIALRDDVIKPMDADEALSKQSPQLPKKDETLKPQTRSALRGEEVYQRLLQSAVFLASPHGMGSGFVFDSQERLVMTNAHVVGKEVELLVHFPRYSDAGELLTNPDDYNRRQAIGGRVLHMDRRCDLAVVKLERLPENAKAVQLATKPAPTGATVYSVGGSGVGNKLLWRLTKGTVRGRTERQVKTTAGEVACMVLETDAPINPGDSGGPVMNEYGELVAVVSHFLLFQRQVSGNIDVVEVRRLVQQLSGD